MEIEIIEKRPSSEEYNQLRRAVGWGGYEPEVIDKSLGKEPFYERYGFTARPNESLGSGMTIFWKG
jgi:hypothetical protein